MAEVIITGRDRQTLGELGEFGLIGQLRDWLPPNPRTLIGIGDDAAVLATPDGRVVATTDFLLEGRHFRRDWSSATDVGHKAAARSLADLAAMGAVPSALLVALAVPADLPVSWARDLAAGLAAECLRVEGPGASVIGGDTARADSVLLAVTAIVFLFVHLLPGDPARLVAGPDASLADIAAVRRPVTWWPWRARSVTPRPAWPCCPPGYGTIGWSARNCARRPATTRVRRPPTSAPQP